MAGFSIQEPFELQEQRRGDLTILFAVGPIEKRELSLLETALKQLLGEGRKRVILDFSEVTHLSALLVPGLVICAESVRVQGGEMIVTGVSTALRKCIQMIDTAGTIILQPDVVAAMKTMAPHSGPSLIGGTLEGSQH
jgi:anti-anti-sigma regulatory factor